MSRIILARHDNGEEFITIGHDRPLQHFFWSECDEEGESVDESYMDRGLVLHTTEDLVNAAAVYNDRVFRVLLDAIDRGGQDGRPEPLVELKRHSTLDYPESNIILDLSGKE